MRSPAASHDVVDRNLTARPRANRGIRVAQGDGIDCRTVVGTRTVRSRYRLSHSHDVSARNRQSSHAAPVQLRSASFGAMRQERILNGRWADKHAGVVIKDAAAIGGGIAGQSAVGHALSNTVRAISFPDKHTPWPSTVPCRLRTCPRTRYRSCPLLGRSTRACCRCCART